MSDAKLSTPGLDEIMAHIRDEAARLQQEFDADSPRAAALPLEYGDGLLGELAACEPLEVLIDAEQANPVAVASDYRLASFRGLSDEGFISAAYRRVLGRDVDPTGQDGYGRHLAAGGSRAYVLADLVRSEEGRRLGMRVEDLGVGGRLCSLRTVPLVGRFVPIADRLFGRLMRALRKREDVLARIDHQRNMLRSLARFAEQRLRSLEGLAKIQAEFMEGQARRIDQQQGTIDELRNSMHALFDEQRGTIDDLRNSMHALFDEQRGTIDELRNSMHGLLDEQRGSMDGAMDELRHTVDILVSDHTYQRRRIDALSATPAVSPAGAATPLQAALDKYQAYYVAFEDACRGSRDEIRATQEQYLPLLQDVDAGSPDRPVLDVGCGRGEWLGFLAEHGLAARGVDSNTIMIAECREQGFQVECGDAVHYLRRLADESLGAVTAFHVIEHLPFETLYELLAEASRCLAPDGVLVAETPNPENVLVGSHTFYHDPTHRNPITPTGIEFLARYHGLSDIQILRLHPYPESAKVPGDDALTARVNGHLCGPQDFAIVARKPPVGASKPS